MLIRDEDLFDVSLTFIKSKPQSQVRSILVKRIITLKVGVLGSLMHYKNKHPVIFANLTLGNIQLFARAQTCHTENKLSLSVILLFCDSLNWFLSRMGG